MGSTVLSDLKRTDSILATFCPSMLFLYNFIVGFGSLLNCPQVTEAVFFSLKCGARQVANACGTGLARWQSFHLEGAVHVVK